MQRIKFSKVIMAPAEKVYRTMLGLDDIRTYEQWTAEFNPTSTYEGNWDEGSKIYFVGTDEEGNRGGMVSEIVGHIPNRFVSIRHYGILQGHQEITTGEEVEKWAGGLENYTFAEVGGSTTVIVETDTTGEFLDYFNETWPKALDKLAELVESK